MLLRIKVSDILNCRRIKNFKNKAFHKGCSLFGKIKNKAFHKGCSLFGKIKNKAFHKGCSLFGKIKNPAHQVLATGNIPMGLKMYVINSDVQLQLEFEHIIDGRDIEGSNLNNRCYMTLCRLTSKNRS